MITHCVVVAQCATPEVPDNGYITKASDTHIKYYCAIGYELEGQHENYCLQDYWAFPLPRCNSEYILLYCIVFVTSSNAFYSFTHVGFEWLIELYNI